jgi:exodeoxyribonuclease-5
LPPVGESESYALSKDFWEQTFNLTGSSHLLTVVKRQEDGSFILDNAEATRQAIDDKLQKLPIDAKEHPNIYKAADEFVKNQQKEGLEKAVSIGVSHKANRFFNDLVRERVFGKAKKILEKGDLLMVTRNWHRNGISLFNGDHVELLEVDWNLEETVADLHFVAVKVRLLFSETEVIIEDLAILDCILATGGSITPSQENHLRHQRTLKNQIFRTSTNPADDRYVGALRLMYGNAITCNKAQGGEWKKVFINTWGIPSLKWQYTAITRAQEDLEKF